MFKVVIFLLALLSAQIIANVDRKPRECIPRIGKSQFSIMNSIYCVCNSTYCDDAPRIYQSNDNMEYAVVSSTQSGERFNVRSGRFGQNITFSGSKITNAMKIDSTITYQEIIGFGGSMTDATGINIKSLSEPAQEELLKSYFSDDGLEYTMIRVPMGSSDFSERSYSYAETKDDVLLKHFSLAEEDFLYKIPYIQKAIEMNKRPIKLISSPWSGALWMKDNNNWVGGCLKREYWQLWANYFVKFFQEYKIRGINFWGLTPQNEPLMAFLPAPISDMGWTAWQQRDWIIHFLKPTLKEAGLNDIDIIIGDGQRSLLPLWPKVIMHDSDGREAVSGTAVHWYFDMITPLNQLDETRKLFPDKYIIYTESCAGPPITRGGVHLGSWNAAEMYATSIIETISHWVAGWLDWNMVLDLNGGPNWLKNFADSSVIVNSTADEFYKQPSFYVMGHFSKYVTPGSVRISTSSKDLFGIPSVAFKRPDNATVVILLNTYSHEKIISVSDTVKGTFSLTLPKKSIHSLIYW